MMNRRADKNNTRLHRGFTLMELLIVVAIIAVLVAVAIPVFTSSLEKSREAADLANIRAAYAEVMIEHFTDEEDYSMTVTLTQKQDGWMNGSTAPDTLANLGTVNGTPAADGTCTISWPEGAEKILFDFTGSGTGSGGGSGGIDRSAGRYIEDENDIKSVMTGIAAFIFDTMKDSSAGSIRYEGSRNNADGNTFLATDYKVLFPHTFSEKNVEWGNGKGTYADYLTGTDITSEIIGKTSADSETAKQTDIYLDKETNLPIAVGYYKDGTNTSDYMITYLDENGNPAETRDIGYPNYRQCFAYQKEYVLEHFDEDTRPSGMLGNDT